MQPRAVLVLYEPGHRFKNHKYLLSLGPNVVGNDSKCQVFINSKQYFSQDYVANFFITEDFMYIQALCDNMVQFKSNMQVESSGRKKDVYRYIDKNCRYVLQMEEIFYIGPYKAIVQVQTVHELKQIKNVLNIENFQTPRGDEDQIDLNLQKIEKNPSQSQKDQAYHEIDAKSDGTQKIDSECQDAYAPTLEINNDDPFAYEPTLLILDERPQLQKKSSSQYNNLSVNYPNEARSQSKSPHPSPLLGPYKSPQRSPLMNPIASPNSQQSNNTRSIIKKAQNNSQISQLSMLSRQKDKRPQPFSQQALLETIKKQQKKFHLKGQDKHEEEQDDISMPDTIKDQESQKQLDEDDDLDMPDTILDHEFPIKPRVQNDDDQMPDTIKDDEFPIKNRHPNQDDDEDMPDTIKDDEFPLKSKVNKKQPDSDVKKQEPTSNQKAKISKTMHQKKQKNPVVVSKALHKSQKLVHSFDNYEDDDILNMLNNNSMIRKVDSNEIQINEEKQKKDEAKDKGKKKSLIDSSGFEKSIFGNGKVLKSDFEPSGTIARSSGSNLEKDEKEKQKTEKKPVSPSIENGTNSNKGKRRLFKEQQKPKMANLSGFAPKAEDRLALRQRGYQIVPNGDTFEYELMIYNRASQVSAKLLMAILLDKQIVNQEWVKDKQWQEKDRMKPEGSILGISWDIVNIQRGKKDIFVKAGNFYFTESLKEFGNVFEYSGGNRVEDLSKRKKLVIVIHCEKDEDQKFYRENKNCKNWSFYSHKLIVQSVLLGEIPFKKYAVDETSF